jgi:hypothetical protein
LTSNAPLLYGHSFWQPLIALREIKKWKHAQFSKKGSGAGHHVIDRGAEKAVFHVLQEKLVAHRSRKGCAVNEQRIAKKTMRCIANNYLEKNGKKLIKSYQTVRSFGKPKYSRSIQSKQHRCKALWSHKRPEKVYTEADINLHYNQAHVKMYTRSYFQNKLLQNTSI